MGGSASADAASADGRVRLDRRREPKRKEAARTGGLFDADADALSPR